MTVRAADENDLDVIVDLFMEYLEFYHRTSERDRCRNFLRDRLRNGDAVVLLAASARALVGFAQLYPTWSSLRQCRGYILNDLYVRVEARRTGVGRELLRAAVQAARAQGAAFLQLETEMSNVAAQSLYRAEGWVATEGMMQFTWSLP